jgi:hypothetical protein
MLAMAAEGLETCPANGKRVIEKYSPGLAVVVEISGRFRG